MKVTAVTLVAIIFAAFAFAEDDDSSCKMHPKKSPQRRITEMLRCDYDVYERPVDNHQNATKVYLRMVLKRLDLNVEEENLNVHAWLVVQWKDVHLTWDPKSYENVKLVHLSSMEIWTPDLSIYNKHDFSEHPGIFPEVRCLVTYSGDVLCVVSAAQDAFCKVDSTHFPFDVQNCTLRIGSWVHSGEQVSIDLLTPAITLEDYKGNGEYKLLKAYAVKNTGKYKCCPNDTYPSLIFTFTMKRQSGVLIASVFIPALVMVLTTLVTLWMNPVGMDRFCLCCANLLMQMLYVTYVRWEVPAHGETTPTLIAFARDSFLLSTFALLLTVVLRKMLLSKGCGPNWMTKIIGTVVQSKPGQFVLLQNNYTFAEIAAMEKDEDSTNIVNETETQDKKDWLLFAVVLDRIAFVGFIITYIILFAAFVP